MGDKIKKSKKGKAAKSSGRSKTGRGDVPSGASAVTDTKISQIEGAIVSIAASFRDAGKQTIANEFEKVGKIGIKALREPDSRHSYRARSKCAIKGCPDLAVSKGYCRKDYQYQRRFKHATGKMPAGWSENPKPQSIERQRVAA